METVLVATAYLSSSICLVVRAAIWGGRKDRMGCASPRAK